MSLEDEFEIDISDDEASRLHTAADILACVPGGCRKEKSGSDQSAGLIVSGRPFSGQCDGKALRFITATPIFN
jgi:hypothetical protein